VLKEMATQVVMNVRRAEEIDIILTALEDFSVIYLYLSRHNKSKD